MQTFQESETNTIDNSQYSILIAEDEQRLLESMQFMLKRKGYTVYGATSGTEALAIISKHHSIGHPIDLLITDIQMSGMNGEALIQAVRTFDLKMRVLVITAFGDKDLVVRLMRLGCGDFIDKPFGLVQMEFHVNDLLHQSYLETMARKRKEHHALMGEQARTMIHDLNNLLGTTLGYAELAVRDVEEHHPVRTKVKKIFASAQVASEIAHKLTRLKAEEKHPVKVKTDLSHLVKNIASVVAGIARESIEVRSEISYNDIWLNVDPERIHQALLNLGMNALDAMPNGGSLTFTLTLEEISLNQSLPPVMSACIAVRDTGVGMSEETIGKIFTENFTTKSNGHGIGLYAVKSIVKAHDGEIKVQSEINKGTEFKLYFPIMEYRTQ